MLAVTVSADVAADEWARMVATVATMPGLIERLAADHIPNDSGRCRACTTPGFGTPGARWPCALAVLAADAARARTDEGQ